MGRLGGIMEKKTPSYTARAVANYRDQHNYCQLHLKKGLKDQMKTAGITNMSEYISGLIIADLERRKNQNIRLSSKHLTFTKGFCNRFKNNLPCL
jgi:hypothetical protein